MRQSTTRTMVVHIGSTKFGRTFDWANAEDTLRDKIVLTIGCVTQPDSELFATMTPVARRGVKARLDQLHLRKIDLAHEALVINLTDYIGESTLHELCYSYNQKKVIRWLEDWSMYCPLCRCHGPQSQHFFHTSLTMQELSRLLDDDATHPYLVGQLVEWYGQIVPVVCLTSGELALQVDPPCVRCGKPYETYYARSGRSGGFTRLVDGEGTSFVDLRSADQRNRALVCADCASLRSDGRPASVLRRLTIRQADQPGKDITKTVPVADLPAPVLPLAETIAEADFERLVLRKGLVEITITSGEEALPLVVERFPTSGGPGSSAIFWKDLVAFALRSPCQEELEVLAAVIQLYQEMGSVPERATILERIRKNVETRDGESSIRVGDHSGPVFTTICQKYGLIQAQS